MEARKFRVYRKEGEVEDERGGYRKIKLRKWLEQKSGGP